MTRSLSTSRLPRRETAAARSSRDDLVTQREKLLREVNHMETYCFVRPEYLNHQGFLFGGQLLRWIDEYTWLAAARDFPGCILVTRAMDNIQFRKRVSNGAILRFEIAPSHQGNTSVTYTAEVYASSPASRDEEMVFSTHVTFVAVNEHGEKVKLPETNRT